MYVLRYAFWTCILDMHFGSCSLLSCFLFRIFLNIPKNVQKYPKKIHVSSKKCTFLNVGPAPKMHIQNAYPTKSPDFLTFCWNIQKICKKCAFFLEKMHIFKVGLAPKNAYPKCISKMLMSKEICKKYAFFPEKMHISQCWPSPKNAYPKCISNKITRFSHFLLEYTKNMQTICIFPRKNAHFSMLAQPQKCISKMHIQQNH